MQDPWAENCQEPVFLLQILPAVRSLRVTARCPSGAPPSFELVSLNEIAVNFNSHHSDASWHDPASRPHRVLLQIQTVIDHTFQPIFSTHDNFSPSISEARFTLAETKEGILPHTSLDAQSMKGVSALHCGTCGVQLSQDACFGRILALPSPFWHEMADMWICHDDFRCLSPIAKLGESDMRARRGHCLHGEHELLVHAGDLLAGCLEWGAGRADSLWGIVRCSRCQGPLGVALMGGGDAPQGQGAQAAGGALRSSAKASKGRAHTKRSAAIESPSHTSAAWLANAGPSAVPGADSLTSAGKEQDKLLLVMPDGSTIGWKELADSMDDDGDKSSEPPNQTGWAADCTPGPSSDVKIYKHWAASSADAGGATDLLAGHTLLRRCSHTLLQTSGAHGSYKFMLRAVDRGLAPCVLLSLMGWAGSVSGNKLGMIDDNSMRLIKGTQGKVPGHIVFDKQAGVVTCMYVVWSDDEHLSRALLDKWREDSPNDVENLDLLQEECEAVADALRCSTLLLPPTQRIVGGLPVGFLPT